MLRRSKKKKKQQEEALQSSGTVEQERLSRAEEDYLQRLSDSIQQGNVYITRPKGPSPEVLERMVPPAEPGAASVRPPVAPPVEPKRPADFTSQVEALIQAGATQKPGSDDLSKSAVDRVIKSSAPRPPAAPPISSVPPPPAPPVAESRPPTPPPVIQAPPPPPREPVGTFPKGAILQLEDGTVAIYKDPVKGKEYEIVYVLRADGRAAPEGIALYAYEARQLGTLSPDYFEEIQKTLKWDREVILFHLDKLEHRESIPRPVEKKAGPRPDPPTGQLLDPKRDLSRGRRIRISFGPGKSWDAVYWGRDLLGHVLAHRTHSEWALMHLDLKRFRDSIDLGEFLSKDEIETVQHDIMNTKERSGD